MCIALPHIYGLNLQTSEVLILIIIELWIQGSCPGFAPFSIVSASAVNREIESDRTNFLDLAYGIGNSFSACANTTSLSAA